MTSTPILWGVIATGAIGKTFARNLAHSQTGKLYAVASRSQASADAFAKEFGASKAYGSYEAILNDPQMQAVYISPPHPMHAEWTIRACEAKKHVLCEKPFGVNAAEAMAMIEAAIANDVMLMEAFMYRCHPQTAKLVELIKSKSIGDVRVIQATFSYQAGFDAERRTFNNKLAGGGILDVGCYPISMSRLVAGAANGNDFANPTELTATAHLGQTGVDEWAIASLKFPGEILAQISTGVGVNQESVVRIFGSEGRIVLPNPWQANRTTAEPGRIILQRNGEREPQEIVVEANVTSFTYEADVFGNALLAGKRQASAPAMSWDDTMGNMRTLDQWRKEIGLTYDIEKRAGYPRVTVSGHQLRNPFSTKAKPAPSGAGSGSTSARNPTPEGVGFPKMIYGEIPHVAKKVARLIMGVDNQTNFPHSAVMFDDYFERGGNTFDTAYIYGSGRCEKLLGEWVHHRGVRKDVAILAKGAHTPFCDPKSLSRQLIESLDRLQMDGVEMYVMHRDNTDVPVGEFVDCLNEHLRAGRIQCFGGSNWSLARVDEANAHAQKTSQRAFSVVSNNFSLARMVNPPWGGCISASDPESRAWLKEKQMPLLAWSSQARGFFLEGRAAPEKREDEELVRCWYADDNFKRLERVKELAKRKNVLPINIALAYVLHQPFPTFALIGPRQLSETRTSLKALEISLSPDELKWLNLED